MNRGCSRLRTLSVSIDNADAVIDSLETRSVDRQMQSDRPGSRRDDLTAEVMTYE